MGIYDPEFRKRKMIETIAVAAFWIAVSIWIMAKVFRVFVPIIQ